MKNMEIIITWSYIYNKTIIKNYDKTTSLLSSFISSPESVSSASIAFPLSCLSHLSIYAF